uniref:Uncharacterized protein n=1 Tax=Romanomermis culicivorax TaxID=13658 RepID=A0A915K959_ROMCU
MDRTTDAARYQAVKYDRALILKRSNRKKSESPKKDKKFGKIFMEMSKGPAILHCAVPGGTGCSIHTKKRPGQ